MTRSIVTVTTPATHKRLTTPERVQAEVPVVDDENRAMALIEEASAAVVSFCRREFALQSYSEKCAGFGGNILLLARSPIVGTPTVTGPDSIAITDFLVDAERGWLVREDGWVWTVKRGGLIEPTPLAGTEALDYTVVYDAGYVLPGDDDGATARTLPYDVERAAIEIVRAIATAPDPDVASERIGDYAVTYREPGAPVGMLPPRVEALLMPYRRGA